MRESDEIIYRRYLAEGSNEDMKELMFRHRESLTLFLHGMGLGMDDAEELMIDSFAVVGLGQSIFQGRSSFKTWLFAIGRNKALKHLKAIGRRSAVPLEEHLAAHSAPEDELFRQERDRQLYSAMNRLKPEYSQILYLTYFEDMSVEEAGRVMKKTRKQVYNLIQRSKEALKRELAGDETNMHLHL